VSLDNDPITTITKDTFIPLGNFKENLYSAGADSLQLWLYRFSPLGSNDHPTDAFGQTRKNCRGYNRIEWEPYAAIATPILDKVRERLQHRSPIQVDDGIKNPYCSRTAPSDCHARIVMGNRGIG
jgi:hypothetical protein